MSLHDAVAAACARLAPAGWGELLAAHGLDLGAADLRAELQRELAGIDRSLPGFEDFSVAGRRAIEPGRPAESLLLHAFASPNVTARPGGEPLEAFPTLAELEAVENLVFAAAGVSLDELLAPFTGVETAVVVMAYEYRPAVDTVHRTCADLCFSRTGVSRVGTAPPRYGAAERGFLPVVEADPHAVAVLPARYAPWLAAALPGDPERFGPMNFDLRHRFPGLFEKEDEGDAQLTFWVPLHKLFSGSECLRGLDLTVELQTGHVNEKLRRAHQLLGPEASGGVDHDLDAEPFLFRDGLAELSTEPAHGTGLVVPVPHERLVEPALLDGAPLDFVVPPNLIGGGALGPTLGLPVSGRFRPGPEYLHARHRMENGQLVEDLNDDPDVLARVEAGGYRALHYIDFTGDGWVAATCPELAGRRTVPAYSLITAPDFYPDVDQREISEWWLSDEAPDIAWRAPPLTLSDVRLLPNVQHPDGRLVATDGVASAIVAMRAERPAVEPTGSAPLKTTFLGRHPHLPDAAASVFAPGWDVSVDGTPDAPHMAAYGLGSPFPEDAKLCAALSSFWPAVAPDAGRSFSWLQPTVAPLSDEEIGSAGAQPWDGVPGPRSGPGQTIELASWDHADYVGEALAGRFTMVHTSRVSTAEYAARVLAMSRAYVALETDGEAEPRDRWRVIGFRALATGDAALADAEAATGNALDEPCFAITLALPAGDAQPVAGDPRTTVVEVSEIVVVLLGAAPVVLIERGGTWRALAA